MTTHGGNSKVDSIVRIYVDVVCNEGHCSERRFRDRNEFLSHMGLHVLAVSGGPVPYEVQILACWAPRNGSTHVKDEDGHEELESEANSNIK